MVKGEPWQQLAPANAWSATVSEYQQTSLAREWRTRQDSNLKPSDP